MQKSTIFPEIKMRCLNCLILLLLPLCLWSQSPVGFEDGMMQIRPGNLGWRLEQFPPNRWGLDSIDPISGHYSLHHTYDNPQAACDYFIMQHHPFQRSSLSLSFRIRHSYPPSSGNNWQLAFLADFDGILREGIVVGVNLMGSDDLVRLWRARNGTYEDLCASALNFQEEIGMGLSPYFRLAWHWEGKLTLWYAMDSTSEMQELASCVLPELPSGRSLVLRYEYSAAQDRKLWLDDIRLEGNFAADTIAPDITGWIFESGNILILSFSEMITWSDSSGIVIFQADQSGGPLMEQTMVPDSFSMEKNILKFFFPDVFPNRKSLVLKLHGVCDRDGNLMSDTSLLIMRNEPVWGDLVINEVMADPEPPVLHTLDEYVELYNRSDYPLNLEGWWMNLGDRMFMLGEAGKEAIIQPGDYRVIYPSTLNNQGSILSLYSRDGELVHAASYRIPYSAPQWKKEGGWSLESPDPEQVCNVSQLWEYSEDRSGGTPGKENSVWGHRPDKQAPRFLYFGYEAQGVITLHFSEAVIMDTNQTQEVIINPGNHRALDLIPGQPLRERLSCRFAIDPSLLSHYSFSLPPVSDCSGNYCKKLHFEGGSAIVPGKGSVLINEIMYDPPEGAAEYIELYNPGQYYVDIAELAIDVSGEGEEKEDLVPLSDRSRIMGPGEYLVLTGNILHLLDSYGLEISGCWVELDDFESLPDGGGRIRLSDRSGKGIDEVSYKDDLHMAIISDTRGIALERIDSGRPGDDPDNWHSAASIEGFATPGRLNSQALPESGPTTELILEPSVFSPDNDGRDDLLVILPGIEEAGSVIRLWITQPDGALVRILANNHVGGPSSHYSWDGRSDDGQMAASGFYVVHLRGYNPISGKRWNCKRALGLYYR